MALAPVSVDEVALYYTLSLLNTVSVRPEYSLEGLDAEAETPILWPPDAKN